MSNFKTYLCCNYFKDCNHTYQDLATSEKIVITFKESGAIYDIVAHPNWLKKLRDKDGNKIGPVDTE